MAERREWLVTNGLGGYAMGTVSGLLTRRYHGLLVAALDPPLGRTVLLSKLDETACYDGQEYPLFANRWLDGIEEPRGYRYLEHFQLEGTTPVWGFALADGLLEKTLWMAQGANTTYISYRRQRGMAPVTITAKILANYRNYHGSTEAGSWQTKIRPLSAGLQIAAPDDRPSLNLLCEAAEFFSEQRWYAGVHLSQEEYQGQAISYRPIPPA